PEQRDVPLVGVLVDGVHARPDAVRRDPARRLVEARDVLGVDTAGAAGRDLGDAGIGGQVDVQFAARGAAARLLPPQALEVAAVLRDRVDVVPAPTDRADERVGQPAGAVHRRSDLVGELLPARTAVADGLRRGGRSRGSLLRIVATTARGERENRQ